MRKAVAVESRDTLESLIDLVEQGDEVIITRDGRPVAKLIRQAGPVDREAARRAAADIIARSKGVTLGGLRIKDLINEGRR